MVILGVWVAYAQGGARRTGLLAAAEVSPATAEASRARKVASSDFSSPLTCRRKIISQTILIDSF
jgi:hypothetical protein